MFRGHALDIIIKKRDGYELNAGEIHFFIQGVVDGTIADYQAAAWAMAVYFRGMSDAETTALTLAMAASGDQIDLHDSLPPGAIIVDKHSSGGVGDKTTLVAGPVVAACGLPVGKMSGRGLSFTGGTIDKLESIPGWTAELDEARFRRQLGEVGLVVAAQTANLAPADKKLYALRDVTGTVPSMPLIASSIMCKKLAAGADAIVLDVKCGHGAFMETREEAMQLARLMVAIGDGAGRRVRALITQMEQPLGYAVGNALEVKEALATLAGNGPPDFTELVETVCAEMLALGSPSALDEATARQHARAAISSGAALEKLRAFVAAQDGDPRVVDEPDRLPQAPVVVDLAAEQPGYVYRIDSRAIGLAVVDLGGGRRKKEDSIDYGVGALVHAKVGDKIAPGDLLCTVHAADRAAADAMLPRLRGAFAFSPTPTAPLPVLYDRI
jgi:pyrimidine-nucleoside phosphorylase